MTLKADFVLYFKIHVFSEPKTKISMKTDPHYQRQRCSAIDVISADNIRFMRIFVGVPWRRGVKRQWTNRKRRFQGFWCLRHLRKWGQHYYTVLFSTYIAFLVSTDPKIHDLEWLWMDILRWIFTVTMSTVFKSRDQRRCAEADRNPQNIWDPRKDCGSFVYATSSEPLQIRPIRNIT